MLTCFFEARNVSSYQSNSVPPGLKNKREKTPSVVEIIGVFLFSSADPRVYDWIH